MLKIDGSLKSGSGTIVRFALSLASILYKKLHIYNIRAKRKKPGLQPQHLKSVYACCELTEGSVEGATLGASTIIYSPGRRIKGGRFEWDIGTAGSATMMALCLLPLGCFAEKKSIYTITGGLFQDFAPNVYHMKYVLMALLRRFSIQADIELIKPGYIPTGGGCIKVNIEPVKESLTSVKLTKQGKVVSIKGIAISSHLKEKVVCQRMRDACNKVLNKAGYNAEITIIDDTSAKQKGAALFVYAITDYGCLIGVDMAGKLGRSSEEIGKHVARQLLEDIDSGATVDRFTADQLVIYAALADGESEFILPYITEHVNSNLWLIEKILGAKTKLRKNCLSIKGVGLLPRRGEKFPPFVASDFN
jgi:RNA 3'-terminal phosphate cyclase (ATP)